MWQTDLLIDAATEALRQRERELCEEHAVHGLDALDEMRLHPLLAGGFTSAGFGVLREQSYPNEWRLKRSRRGRSPEALPEPRDRLRCDLALLPRPGMRLVDPLAVQGALDTHRSASLGTLFESTALADAPAVEQAALDGVPPTDAYWLEVKLVAQFAYTAGFSGPNRSYASLLRRTAADLCKLAEDPLIARAGLMLVMFTADTATANHDLHELLHMCLDHDLPVGTPDLRHIPIRERIGNETATVALIDLRKPPTA